MQFYTFIYYIMVLIKYYYCLIKDIYYKLRLKYKKHN